mmetsp:Transcript_9808/g.23321  ORF Transcript_9808/g.23321 Transcript_9808/m.23321 type:complete len:255 (+) Transcript_9808:1206-1970(+)
MAAVSEPGADALRGNLQEDGGPRPGEGLPRRAQEGDRRGDGEAGAGVLGEGGGARGQGHPLGGREPAAEERGGDVQVGAREQGARGARPRQGPPPRQRQDGPAVRGGPAGDDRGEPAAEVAHGGVRERDQAPQRHPRAARRHQRAGPEGCRQGFILDRDVPVANKRNLPAQRDGDQDGRRVEGVPHAPAALRTRAGRSYVQVARHRPGGRALGEARHVRPDQITCRRLGPHVLAHPSLRADTKGSAGVRCSGIT